LAYGVHHIKCLLSRMACSPSSGCCMQADQQKSISAVQSALSHALQHVPLLNGATTGAAEQVLLFCSLSYVAACFLRIKPCKYLCRSRQRRRFTNDFILITDELITFAVMLDIWLLVCTPTGYSTVFASHCTASAECYSHVGAEIQPVPTRCSMHIAPRDATRP